MLKKVLIVGMLLASTPALAQEWCGPYPCGYQERSAPRQRGYGWRAPPPPGPDRTGPQVDPCIYHGDCRGQRRFMVPPPR